MTVKLLPTIIGCAILVVIVAQKHAGFMLIFVMFIFIPWFIYSTVIINEKVEFRKLQIAKIFLWTASVLSITATHYVYYSTARSTANYALSKILDYKSNTGRYPARLDVIELSPQKYREGYKIYYSYKGERPFISYMATQTPFSAYTYDFDEKDWIYQGG